MNKNKNIDNGVKVVAKVVVEKGITNGELIIQKNKFLRIIPAVLFRPEEAKTLLRIVDKVELMIK